MNHSNNNKSGQKVTAERIDLDETYPNDSPLKQEPSQDYESVEPIGVLSENDEIIMVSAPIIDLDQLISDSNPPLQSIENVQKLPESTYIQASGGGQITTTPSQNNAQYYYFNYQQNMPQKSTGSSGVSEQRTVDTLVIGGGPAALGLLVNAVKTNRLTELLQGDGLAILDAGINFGGGILGRYGINSNTSGGGFLKCTYKKIKKDKNAPEKQVEDEKKGATKKDQKNIPQNGKTMKAQKGNGIAPNESANPYVQQFAQSSKNAVNGILSDPQNDILPPYKELYTSNISRVLKDFGKNTAPLAVIGHFLNYSGNHLLSFIHQTTKKKIFYPLHKAVSIQLMSNGEILTKVKRQQLEISVTDDSESLKIIETDQVVVFRSRMLVISNGGVQGLHPELFNWFPTLDPSKVVSSDELLRSQTYLKCIKELKAKPKRKIVIIGGSHSGFSCAWMLINGPATYYNNNAGISIEKEPYAHRKSIKNCIDCCQCGSVLINLKRNKQSQQNQQNSQNVTSPNKGPEKPGQKEVPQVCNCLCICFGLFDYDDWKFDFSSLPDYAEADIEILYREQIKVFYNKVSDAEKDGYNQFEQDKFSKKDGYLYSFSGLRGDAKDLYLKIMRGQEKRIALIQAKSPADQRKYVDRADLVVWACGYQTSTIPIKDTDRKRLQLSQKVPNTQYDVDGKCRIMLADGHVLAKTFACGIAYPVRTKDGMMVSNPKINNPRADGFSLYMNFVGDTILKSIIPKAKMIKSTIHKLMPKNQMTNELQALPAAAGAAPQNDFNKKQYQQVLRARIQQYRQKNTDGTDQEVADKQRGIRNKSVNAGLRSSSAAPGQSDDQLSGGHPNIAEKQVIDDEEDDYQHQRFEFDDEDEQNDMKMSLRIQQINAIQRQSNQVQGGTKSVDRGQAFNAKNGLAQGANGGSIFTNNKFSQMARSPQILKRKQENIMKMQGKQGLGDLNSDIALLMTPEGNADQVLAVSRQLKSRKMRNNVESNAGTNGLNTRLGNQQMQSKSPYNQQIKGAQYLKPIPNEGGGSAQIQKNQGVGREILKSSQGANRKLDMILAMQKDIQQPNGGTFKINNRSSQASFTGKQKNKQGSIHQGAQINQNESNPIFGTNIYNSLGSGQPQTIQEINSRSSRQGNHHYDQRRPGGVELPPILHPLAQNHYVFMQEQHLNDLSSINLNQTAGAVADMNNSHDNSNLNLLHQISDLNKSSNSRLYKQNGGNILPQDLVQVNDKQQRPMQQFKSQNLNHAVVALSSFENNKSMRSSSIYQLQSSTNNDFTNALQPEPIGSTLTVHSKARNLNPSNIKTTLNPPPANLHSLLPPPSNRDRPLSDTKREEIVAVNDSQEGSMRVKGKLNSHKKRVTDEMKEQDDEYGTKKMVAKHHKNVHKVMAQSPPPQRQQRILSGDTNESPLGGYENDLFENDQQQPHLAHSQDGEDEDGIDEDVSSEGSCRTSLYQMSHRDDEDYDSNVYSAGRMHNVDKHSKPHSTNHDHEDVKTDFTRSQASGEVASNGIQKSDNLSSKFSFQSKIPRLSKPSNNLGQLRQQQEIQPVLNEENQKKAKGAHSPAHRAMGNKKQNLHAAQEQSDHKQGGSKQTNRFGFSHLEKKTVVNKFNQGQLAASTPLVEDNMQVPTNQQLGGQLANNSNNVAGFNRQQDLKSSHSTQSTNLGGMQRRNTLNPQNSNKQTTGGNIAQQLGSQQQMQQIQEKTMKLGKVTQQHQGGQGKETQKKATLINDNKTGVINSNKL